ncbi:MULTISPECIES: HAD family hydrolase [unclassified Luteococcus]|uniref:HAD family hydrolase n=1 Tax=unclassified Luteococcus TaxID=2639923 RepID=UPI00313B90AC
MRPSLVASDLDGTFLGTDKQVSARNAAAVHRLAELGIPFAVATGRPARWLQCLEPVRDTRPFVIASNGAVVYDLAAERILESDPVPTQTCLDVAHRMRELAPEIHFAVEYGIGWGREPGSPLRGDLVEADVIGPLDALAQRPFVKLLVTSQDRDCDALAELLLPVCDGQLTCTWSIAGPTALLEVSALGVTKAATLTRLADELGVDLADAVAFGDMPNDLAMLHAVGHGYAMADAHPLLRAAGFPTAGGHDDSGVGRTLEALLAGD